MNEELYCAPPESKKEKDVLDGIVPGIFVGTVVYGVVSRSPTFIRVGVLFGFFDTSILSLVVTAVVVGRVFPR